MKWAGSAFGVGEVPGAAVFLEMDMVKCGEDIEKSEGVS